MNIKCQNVDAVERNSFPMNLVSVLEVVHQFIQRDIFYINHTKLNFSTDHFKKS